MTYVVLRSGEEIELDAALCEMAARYFAGGVTLHYVGPVGACIALMLAGF